MPHIFGLLFVVLILGAVASVGDVVGAWMFDRKHNR